MTAAELDRAVAAALDRLHRPHYLCNICEMPHPLGFTGECPGDGRTGTPVPIERAVPAVRAVRQPKQIKPRGGGINRIWNARTQ